MPVRIHSSPLARRARPAAPALTLRASLMALAILAPHVGAQTCAALSSCGNCTTAASPLFCQWCQTPGASAGSCAAYLGSTTCPNAATVSSYLASSSCPAVSPCTALTSCAACTNYGSSFGTCAWYSSLSGYAGATSGVCASYSISRPTSWSEYDISQQCLASNYPDYTATYNALAGGIIAAIVIGVLLLVVLPAAILIAVCCCGAVLCCGGAGSRGSVVMLPQQAQAQAYPMAQPVMQYSSPMPRKGAAV